MRVKLDLQKTNRNVHQSSLRNNMFYIQDGYRDDAGTFKKFPGYTQVLDLGTDSPMDGQYYWQKKNSALAVSNGNLFTYNRTYNPTTLYSGSDMAVRGKARFAEAFKTSDSTLRTFVANGGRIIYTDNTAGNTTSLTGASDPVRCTHVVHIDGYLIANDLDDPTNWFITAVNDQLDFAGGDTFGSPMTPDDIVGLIEANRMLYVIGRQSIETWWNQGGSTPFARQQGGLKNIGSYSGDSITKHNGIIYFMTSDKQIASLSGFKIEIISTDYDKYIQDLQYVDDVYMEVVGGLTGIYWLMVHFPTEGVTLAYDIKSGEWNQKGYWESNVYKQYKGMHYIHATDWGVHLIGDRADSLVNSLSGDTYSENGDTIRTEIVTGNYDHSTLQNGSGSMRKYSRSLHLFFKRGDGLADAPNTEQFCFVYWRDDGATDWQGGIKVGLGKVGNRIFERVLPGMGYYTSRQYKIVHGDKGDFGLQSIEEEVSV